MGAEKVRLAELTADSEDFDHYAGPAYQNEVIRRELEDILRQLRSVRLMSLDDRLFQRFIYPLERAIEAREGFDPLLLADYISELTRVMTNMGVSGIDFTQIFDKVIHFYQQRNLPLVDLYLAKAAYIGLENNEAPERLKLFERALAEAVSTEERLKALLGLVSYHTAISEYGRSVEFNKHALVLIDARPELARYSCEALTLLGVNYFTSFEDPVLARRYFQEAIQKSADFVHDLKVARVLSCHRPNCLDSLHPDYLERMKLQIIRPMTTKYPRLNSSCRPVFLVEYGLIVQRGKRNFRAIYSGRKFSNRYQTIWPITLSTAWHYLGRLEDAEGQYHKAIDHYLRSQAYLEQCPDELGSVAFHHLRLGETLMVAGVLGHAYDHLLKCQEMFNKSDNRSTGEVQLNLALATYHALQGRPQDAENIYRDAIQRAQKKGYVRGELLGLGSLFVFQVRRLRLFSAFFTGWQVLRTLRGGELRRNNIWRMFVRLPYLLRLMLRSLGRSRRPRQAARDTQVSNLESCFCPMHTTTIDGEESLAK